MNDMNGSDWFAELRAAYPPDKGDLGAALHWFRKNLRDADPATRSTVLCWASRYNEQVKAKGTRLADVRYLAVALKARAWESEAAAPWPPTDRPVVLREALFNSLGELRPWTAAEREAAGYTAKTEPAGAPWTTTDKPVPLRESLFNDRGELRCWTPEEREAAGWDAGASR
jgi:hypothetical protein